jgi:hypothetical protein
VTGTVNLTVASPSGVSIPANIPTSVTLTGGQGSFAVKFPTAGFYRIEATGPNGSAGWAAVDVGVNANTAP